MKLLAGSMLCYVAQAPYAAVVCVVCSITCCMLCACHSSAADFCMSLVLHAPDHAASRHPEVTQDRQTTSDAVLCTLSSPALLWRILVG